MLTEGGLLQIKVNEENNLPNTDPGIPPSDIANAVVRMMVGDLAEEAVVAVGPTGVHPDRLYQTQAETYGVRGILYDQAKM